MVSVPGVSGMDDPALEKIAISGPTLASLIQRFSTSPSSLDGLLFGHVTLHTPHTLSDTDTPSSSSSSTTLIATITSFISSPSPSSSINHSHSPNNLIGWFSARRKTPLRPSMREFSISSSLPSPSLFILFTSPPTDSPHSLHIHTHEFRAYQFRPRTMSFEARSLDVVNIGPAFRGHYGSFSPNSPFPVMDCGVGGSPMKEDQKEMDECAEGFDVGRLRSLMGEDAKAYTAGLEDLYGKMLVKIQNLTRLVDQTSAKVFDQENYNRKLKQRILRSAGSE